MIRASASARFGLSDIELSILALKKGSGCRELGTGAGKRQKAKGRRRNRMRMRMRNRMRISRAEV